MGKNPLRSVTSKIVVLAKNSNKNTGKNGFFCSAGSAGVENSACGVGFLTSSRGPLRCCLS